MYEITSFVSLHSEKDTTNNNNDNDKKHDDITIMMIIMIMIITCKKVHNGNSFISLTAKITCQEISFHFFNGRNYFTLSSAFSAKSFFSKKLNSIGSKIYEHTEVQQMTPGMDLAFLIRGGPKAEIFLSCLRKR